MKKYLTDFRYAARKLWQRGEPRNKDPQKLNISVINTKEERGLSFLWLLYNLFDQGVAIPVVTGFTKANIKVNAPSFFLPMTSRGRDLPVGQFRDKRKYISLCGSNRYSPRRTPTQHFPLEFISAATLARPKDFGGSCTFQTIHKRGRKNKQ